MPDREKVIRGLECCKSTYDWSNGLPWKNCPYSNEKECGDCGINQMFADAISLLKEQEPVEMEPHYIDMNWKHFICGVECGNCGFEIDVTDRFCRWCGRPVKYDA